MNDQAVQTTKFNSLQLFNKAEKFLIDGKQDEAHTIYIGLLDDPYIAPIAYFRLGEINNRNKNIRAAYQYHKCAFEMDSKLASKITSTEHIHYNYVYSPIEEVEVTNCPLCHEEGELFAAYNMVTNIDFIHYFDPVKLWRKCNKCNHIFAGKYPKYLNEAVSGTAQNQHLNPNLTVLHLASNILSNITKLAQGNRLLEVGVGAGEMIAVAKEMLFDVTGVEIRPSYAANVSKTFGVPVHCIDIMEFETDQLFDVILLGDVIEHLADPIKMLEKINTLLSENGILWISTPNFESAYSTIMKDGDAMWRVCEHLNYFSYVSLNKVLTDLGFKVIDYKLSQHYGGSMEVIAQK